MSIFSLLYTAFVAFVTVKSYSIREWHTKWPNPYKPGHNVPVNVYYPVLDGSENEQFPLLIFGHCWMGFVLWYDYIYEYLVPQGYIVAYYDSYQAIDMSSYDNFALDNRFVLDQLYDQASTNSSCPIYGMLTNKKATAGHSEGGGAALTSASTVSFSNVTWTQSFDSVMTLSGCGPRKNTIEGIEIPTFLMSGSSDCICSPEADADPYYSELTGTDCKYEAIIANATHCAFGNIKIGMDAKLCDNFETNSCRGAPHPEIPWEVQQQYVVEYMKLFLDATLKSNETDYKSIETKLTNDYNSGIMSEINYDCSL